MDIELWKELGLQCLAGAIYGGAIAAVAFQDLSTAMYMAIGIGALKGAAHAAMKLLAPVSVNAGIPKKRLHWTERIDRIL